MTEKFKLVVRRSGKVHFAEASERSEPVKFTYFTAIFTFSRNSYDDENEKFFDDLREEFNCDGNFCVFSRRATIVLDRPETISHFFLKYGVDCLEKPTFVTVA